MSEGPPAANGLGTGSSVIAPEVVILPMAYAPFSTNQSAPSEPTAMDVGNAFSVGSGNSVKAPPGVSRPMRLPVDSVNQRFPSGPVTISVGPLLRVGMTNSL